MCRTSSSSLGLLSGAASTVYVTPSVFHDENSVAHANQFQEIIGDQNDGHTLRGEIA